MLPRGTNQVKVALPVPQDAQPGPDGIYIIVFFNVPGKGYDGNLVRFCLFILIIYVINYFLFSCLFIYYYFIYSLII